MEQIVLDTLEQSGLIHRLKVVRAEAFIAERIQPASNLSTEPRGGVDSKDPDHVSQLTEIQGDKSRVVI